MPPAPPPFNLMMTHLTLMKVGLQQKLTSEREMLAVSMGGEIYGAKVQRHSVRQTGRIHRCRYATVKPRF